MSETVPHSHEISKTISVKKYSNLCAYIYYIRIHNNHLINLQWITFSYLNTLCILDCENKQRVLFQYDVYTDLLYFKIFTPPYYLA